MIKKNSSFFNVNNFLKHLMTIFCNLQHSFLRSRLSHPKQRITPKTLEQKNSHLS